MFEENQEQEREDKRYPDRINKPLKNEIEIILGIEDYLKNSPSSKRPTAIKQKIASKKEYSRAESFPLHSPYLSCHTLKQY